MSQTNGQSPTLTSAHGVSRRAALKALAATAGAAASVSFLSEAAWAQALAVRAQAAGAPAGLRFFTGGEHRTVDVLSELIIPADERSAGASAAKVADFIDLLLSGVGDDEPQVWREGLAALDAVARARWGAPFADAPAAGQSELLDQMSRHEADPQTPLEKLFVQAKERTVQGYYTSEIGIHAELGYKGNQFLPEFVGCSHPEHGAEVKVGE